MLPTIIAAFVTLSYFIESVFGFGGSILSVALVGSVVDIKQAILIVTYASICASLCILVSDYKSFSLRHLLRIYAFALPGLLIGTFLMMVLNSTVLLKIFAVLLIAYVLYSFLNPTLKLPYWLSRLLLFCGGLIQGIYATGGPFVLMAYGQEFKCKSTLRAVMAGFFLFGNIIRLIQMQVMGKLDMAVFVNFWWLIIPITAGVFGGFFVHLKISDKLFKNGILVLLLIAGVFYLFK